MRGCLLAAVEQIAFADRVLLNKTDLVSEEEKADIKTRIKVPPSRHCTACTEC